MLFPVAALALAQQTDGAIVRGIAGQMKTAEALDCQDFALFQQFARSFQGADFMKIRR